MDLYVYYHVAPEHVTCLQQRVQVMQQQLAEVWNIEASLKRRPDLTEGCQTWMEVYLRVPDPFTAALAEAAGKHALLALTTGERHLETFVDIAACA